MGLTNLKAIENTRLVRQWGEERRLQSRIIDQCNSSIVSTDLDGLITSWNKGAEALFGYAAEASWSSAISSTR